MKNTLLSDPSLSRFARLPKPEQSAHEIADVIRNFGTMKTFAGEIQTEVHLVKPILKALGYTFEAKPKFFEEHVKGPDFALFDSDEHRAKSGHLWGTKAYYDAVLAVMQVKRYGRNLEEGISGFYLEFENRMPMYQCIYLTKMAGTPWGILTNGKNWLLLKKPVFAEKRMIEIDLEQSVEGDGEMLYLFANLFSSTGLRTTLPDLLNEERTGLIGILKEKKSYLLHKTAGGGGSKTELYGAVPRFYGELYPGQNLGSDQTSCSEERREIVGRRCAQAPFRTYDQSDIFAYLFASGAGSTPDLEQIIMGCMREERTKEHLLSLKILDMTPGFGALAVQLVDTLAYLSFLLPYREKHTFTAEWEHEPLLNRFIIGNILYGVEKYRNSLDVLHNAVLLRFNSPALNYRLGNPLLGAALTDIQGPNEEKKEAGLFSTQPYDAINEFKNMNRLYFSLSDRIKEDAVQKRDLEGTLELYRERFREVMNAMTAAYFDHTLENKKTRELLYSMDGGDDFWDGVKKSPWFLKCQEIAQKKHFFHMEVEFPFLLANRFDLIFIQPALQYLWEEKVPLNEITKAYIKRAMTYLKQTGKAVLIGGDHEQLIPELRRSRKYTMEEQDGALTIRRRQ